jgi:hypothetical protein
MEALRLYPLMFLFTVVVPVLVGVVTAGIGYDNLRGRARGEHQQREIASTLSAIKARVGDLGDSEAILHRYEQSLAKADFRDATLQSVLAQYSRLRQAADRFSRHNDASASEETSGLAEEIVSLLQQDIYPIRVDERLPGRPLLILVAPNAYRVLFDVPMRIPPRLTFYNLPEGTFSDVQAVTRFGFTVVFQPESIAVERFDFMADAEL